MTEPLGIVPETGPGAQADEFAVVRSPYPFGAVAAAPEFVAVVFTVCGVTGVDGQHRAPTSSGEIARRMEVGQKAQRTNYVQNCASILPVEDKLLKTSNLELVEAAGVERFFHRVSH